VTLKARNSVSVYTTYSAVYYKSLALLQVFLKLKRGVHPSPLGIYTELPLSIGVSCWFGPSHHPFTLAHTTKQLSVSGTELVVPGGSEMALQYEPSAEWFANNDSCH